MATKKPTSSKSQTKTTTPKPTSLNDAKSTEPTKPVKASKSAKKEKKPKTPRTTKQKMVLASLIFISILLVAAAITTIVLLLTHKSDIDKAERAEFTEPIYSTLTGEEIASEELNNTPTYCVQIPNGSTDGARPQAGLNQAGVVFEAIAERGITRFAAVFQNANTSVIGPIRSLRPYYLDWDTPFDCTVVHAGGSDEAIADISTNGQRNLDESLEYMWRENSDRSWNNLFTSPADIAKFNTAQGYNTSDIKAFPRYKPEETDAILAEIETCKTESTDESTDTTCQPTELIDEITIDFGPIKSYNTIYHYDLESNTYLRSYADGNAHLSYNCPSDLNQPNTMAACGEPTQIAPRVVIAMFVQESTAGDGYHENINTISAGSALIFQNGDVIEASWSKTAQNSQITFRDSAGEDIKLAPGQLWIAAVPQYGNVDY